MNWIKEKLKRFWGWVTGGLVAIGLIGIVLAAAPASCGQNIKASDDSEWTRLSNLLATVENYTECQGKKPNDVKFSEIYQAVLPNRIITHVGVGVRVELPYWQSKYAQATSTVALRNYLIDRLQHQACLIDDSPPECN